MRRRLALAALAALASCHGAGNRAAPGAATKSVNAASGALAYLPALAPAEPARAATSPPPRSQELRGTVAIGTASGARRGALDLVDVTLGGTYHAAIVYPGAGEAAPPAAARTDGIRLDGAAGGVAALVRDNPRALVMNGGFSASDAAHPAGLLLIDGRALNPFAFDHYGNDPAKALKLAAVVCVTATGQIRFLRAADFAAGGAAITDRCRSAFQTTPFVAQGGQSRISAREPDLKAPAARTLLGFDRGGVLHAVFFRSPVSLAVAAAVALAPAGADAAPIRVTGSTARGFTADHGLALTDAVNLDGDAESTGAFLGKPFAGDPARELPSAMVVLP